MSSRIHYRACGAGKLGGVEKEAQHLHPLQRPVSLVDVVGNVPSEVRPLLPFYGASPKVKDAATY